MSEDLPPRIKYWLTEEELHDCFFLVGFENEPQERIGAIKALLRGDSKPFRVMLGNGALAENGEIEIKDVEPETFRNFLPCAYGASSFVIPKLTFEESAKLLYVVDKYLYVEENVISDVACELTGHMKRFIQYENMFVCLSHPVCYQTSTPPKGGYLGKEILEILRYDFDKIANDDKFLSLSNSAMSWILQQEPIHVREIEIWNAVLRWAKHKTGSNDGRVLRPCILDFLKYIRFLTMEYVEFSNEVVCNEILLEEEYTDICKAFVFNKPCDIEHLCSNRTNRYSIVKASTCIDSSVIDYTKSILIHCSVSSISDLQDKECSKTYLWAEHLWCLAVGKTKTKDGEKDTLGMWLYCCNKNSICNCTVDIELRLINKSRDLDTNKKITTTFNKPANGIGYTHFFEWNALLNPDNGFVNNNIITFEAIIGFPVVGQS